jgi:hypothetical protein
MKTHLFSASRKNAQLALLGLALSGTLATPIAQADGGLSAAAVAIVIEAGNQLRDLGNGGDLKIAILNGKGCGRSKNDGENRGARLARYYRELLSAAQANDANLMYERSVRLNEWVNKSSMYQSCFNAMGNAAKAMAVVDKIVAAKGA